MKVSIITACYNSEKTISKTIKSVINQSYENIEYIIVDGSSNDGTLKIINDFKKKSDLKFIIISENDLGIYDALNKGIKLSKGEIIGFLHSDDFLANTNVISEIVKSFSKNEVDGIYGDLVYVYKNNVKKILRYWKSKNFKNSLLINGWMPPHPTLYLRKSVYKKHGFFNLHYKISSDYDFIIRIFKDEVLKFKYIPMVITKMRYGGISNGNLINIFHKIKEDFIILRKNNVGNLFTLLKKNFSKIEQFFFNV